MVEHTAVNRGVVGSSPTGGAGTYVIQTAILLTMQLTFNQSRQIMNHSRMCPKKETNFLMKGQINMNKRFSNGKVESDFTKPCKLTR